MIFFTHFAIPEGFAGCARGPLIFIRPTHKDDVGLIAHEKVHRWQWFRTLGLHSIFYLLDKDYRLRAEVEAYREQLKHSPHDLMRFAEFLVSKYNLGIPDPLTAVRHLEDMP